MQKEIITSEDICVMFEVSKDTAYAFINGIKSVSDTLGIVGKVHKQDYELWLQSRLGKTEKFQRKTK